MGEYQSDFDAVTAKYAAILQEVRVILKEDSGASQFFPPGTPESVIWASIISREELNG